MIHVYHPHGRNLSILRCSHADRLTRGGHHQKSESFCYCTVSVALLLVTLPTLLVTTTEYREPLSAMVVAGVVYEALFAPKMFWPFLRH